MIFVRTCKYETELLEQIIQICVNIQNLTISLNRDNWSNVKGMIKDECIINIVDHRLDNAWKLKIWKMTTCSSNLILNYILILGNVKNKTNSYALRFKQYW